EVVHHPEKTGGQEKAHGVMAVPPLDHRVGRTRIRRIRLEQAHWQRHVVDDVQHRRDHDKRTVEPVTDIDVLGLAFDDGAEEHRRVGEDHKVGVQRSKASERGPGKTEVQVRPNKL
nr:hypothetical protein [Tanacetum cinerariifolium]